jgi:hypothetical protein
MYDDLRVRLDEQYQDTCTRIALLSLRDLAESVHAAFENVATIVMSDSDLGPYLVLDYVEDHTGQLVADSEQLAAAGIHTESTAGNLFTDYPGSTAWERYAPRDRAADTYRLDIAQARTIPVTAFTPRP